MNKSPQYNQHSKSEVEEICFHQNMESVRNSILLQNNSIYLKINSGFHARKNPKQQYLKVVMFIDLSFSKKRISVYGHAAKITH